MKILHVPHAYAPVNGGAELLCARVGEELARMGHRVRVVTSDVGSVDGYYRFGVTPVRQRPPAAGGVEIVTLPFGGALYEPGGRWAGEWLPGNIAQRLQGRLRRRIVSRFRAGLRREILAFQPDVVMTLPHLVVNVEIVMQLRNELSFPLVWLPLLHDNQADFAPELFRAASRQVDAAVALTSHEASLLCDSCGFAPAAVFHAGVGMDLPAHLPQTLRSDTVLFLGRKDPAKGVPELLRAMQLVWQRRPNTALVLAGARTPDTAVVDSLVAALPAAQRSAVRSLDDVSEQSKFELLVGSRCLVLPSKKESFGLVLLEAWSCATPVVTYDLPVFRCTVDDGENGLLARVDSDCALADAILRLLEDPAFAGRLGSAGRRKIEAQFRWSLVAERFLQAYSFAIASNSRKSSIGT